MNCFSCFSSHEKKASKKYDNRGIGQSAAVRPPMQPRRQPSHGQYQQLRPENDRKFPDEATNQKADNKGEGNNNIAAQTFTFRELATATKNFRQECLLGEGGFGRVYKGRLERTGQEVAVKQLDRNGLQGNREFLVEVLMLSLLHHQNLVNLIGYCADGDQRLLVYEYMSLGSLEDHLLEIPPGQPPLDWHTRMKIALNAAKGLEYLHDKANPPVIYRDLKSSNILLDKEFNAKLSDFGLAKLGPVGDKSHVSSRVMGTYGYCAPEYQKTGQLTVKSDVYSFGVVFLELITGRRAIDTTRSPQEQNLVTWVEPMFREPSRFSEVVDPLLQGNFPRKSLNQAMAIAAMCVNEDASVRPLISDVVSALSYLWVGPDSATPAGLAATCATSHSLTLKGSAENNHEDISAKERQKAVAEAIEWGSNSRTNHIRSLVSQDSSL
ncbi:hypothetical protein ACH5RR_010445 [Cinchona calisaya]|uniref:non-specific serine/threonine protein kinase n=1 Tax=Cinchona calisaya TaxID=153742 RepID=A0ABD3AIZ6_9GENT